MPHLYAEAPTIQSVGIAALADGAQGPRVPPVFARVTIGWTLAAVLGGSAAAAEVRLAEVAEGLDDPVYLTHAGDGSGRSFVVDQAGHVRVLRNGELEGATYLDISRIVRSGGERGLLSIAFHPGYARNGLVYVNYTDRDGDTVVARY